MKSLSQFIRESKTQTPVYFLALCDENEDEIFDADAARIYYDLDQAIEAADRLAQKYSDGESVCMITVYAGEYENEEGDIFGEPEGVYCASSGSKNATEEVMKKLGYIATAADYYAISESLSGSDSDFLDELSDRVTRSRRNPFPSYEFSRAGWSNIRFGSDKYPAIIWEHDSENKAVLVMLTAPRRIKILYVENADPAYLHYSVKDEINWTVPETAWTAPYLNKLAKILRDNAE